MGMKRYLKSGTGAAIGVGYAGGWLVVDLLTPEPWGDFLLYALMAVVNIVIGWQVAKLFGKSREQQATTDSRTGEGDMITRSRARNART